MTAAHAPGTGRIVVGLDGSASSPDALAWAARQADLTKSSLEIVMTWEWPSSLWLGGAGPRRLRPRGGRPQGTRDRRRGVRAEHPDVNIDPRVVSGHPAPILVEASKGADLLVVGSRGHGEFVGMLIGSVSEYCATNAHCPVLVHRATA